METLFRWRVGFDAILHCVLTRLRSAVQERLLLLHSESLPSVLGSQIYNRLLWKMRTLLKDQAATSPQGGAEFLKPWYQAMLIMIKTAEVFDQGPSTR